MKIKDILTETVTQFSDIDEWKTAMSEIGVDEILREVGKEEYPTFLIYALKGSDRLVGAWNPRDETGVMYSLPGLKFDKRKRQFKLANI